jgi:hypothetical protein
MEDLYPPIIARVCKETVLSTGMEFHSADSFLVITQCFVWARREIEIMPQEAPVVRPRDQVVASQGGGAGGVDVEAADSSSARLEDLKEGLT